MLRYGLFLLAGAAAACVHAGEDERQKVLFLGDGGHHRADARLADAAAPLLNRGIELVYTERIEHLAYENLSRYDALLLYGNRERIADDLFAGLLRYVEEGGGLVAIHSASAWFPDRDEYVELVGGQFDFHGAEVFRTEIVEPGHPLMEGYTPFESWDETYVHRRHNEEDRTVLTIRERSTGEKEPWTWVRRQGEGRVFYTAWGHDERTWRHEGFHDLLERGIRWAAGQDVAEAIARREVGDPFDWREVEVPYPPTQSAREEGIRTMDRIPLPLSPEDSMKRMIVPAGFRLELFAAEPDIRNPIAIDWDERGRLWVLEAIDYPHEVEVPDGEGGDRLIIAEDTTGDGRADEFTVFADGLNMGSGFAFAEGGVVLFSAPRTMFLKDTAGDDRADVREILFEGWSPADTHAGPSNLRYGPDNWLWATVGYSAFSGTVGGEHHRFSQEILRFRPDGSEMEVMRSTSNNTWGLGFDENGLVFGSTANAQPSIHMPFAKRYYELFDAVSPSNAAHIADRPRILPITREYRQVDVLGGYTAAAGHAVYTARTYPEEFWNRTAFVTEPTAHLAGTFYLEPDGAGFRSHNPINLISSDDQWASPIMIEVGPDGHLWIADWYNYHIQHNPVGREGQEAGPGNALITELRDRQHGRIYRLVWEDAEPFEPIDLAEARPDELVAALGHDNMFWRLHAQRLLIEGGYTGVASDLIARVENPELDGAGLDPAAFHALRTLEGLGLTTGTSPRVTAALESALKHPSPGVRRAALQILPPAPAAVEAILSADSLRDDEAQVRMAAALALADCPESDEAGRALFDMVSRDENLNDRWLREAGLIAASQHPGGFLAAAEEADIRPPHVRDRPENLLPNPGFDDVENGMPAGWDAHTWNGDAEFELAEGEGRHGGNALKISSDTGADASWVSPVELRSGHRYRIGGWVRTRNLVNDTGRGAQFNIHNAPTSARTDTLSEGDNDWTYLETEHVHTEGDDFSFAALLGGWGLSTGEVWFDDVVLHDLGSEESHALANAVSLLRDETDPAAPRPGVAEEEDDVEWITVEIGVVRDVLLFDVEEFTVGAGRRVRLVFTNTDHMPHNLLVLNPGTLEEVGRLADRMITEPGAADRDYVPDTDDVLHFTPVLGAGESYTLEFRAPEEPGEYPYVCTFPGHWRIMNGTMTVE